MLCSSFRWLAARVYPCSAARKLATAALAAALAAGLAGCGGGAKKQPAQAWRAVSGDGYRTEIPAGWRLHRRPTRVWATRPRDAVSTVGVSTFRLLKPYRPALFGAASRELDGRTAALARTLGGSVATARTVVVARVRARQYDIADGKTVNRLTYVLRGRTEYLLSCRYPTSDRDPLDGACGRLVAGFRLTAPPA